jgi:NADPH2:quinone reductase
MEVFAMHAVAYEAPKPIDEPDALIDIELPKPEASGHDLLVEIKAVSVNPVDTKVRRNQKPEGGAKVVLGYDAAGVVVAAGPLVTLFKPGDEVFYAGVIDRPGTNAQFHLVDERIVGRKPASLSFAEAAALPLTTITAWEALFDRLDVRRPAPGGAHAILIVGGAGGVGSIATQLARQLTDLTVITTASRPETQAFARELGAHHVIDHTAPLSGQIDALGLGAPAFVFSTTHTSQHFPDIAKLIAPQGRLAVIEAAEPFDCRLIMRKSVSLHWELMFTRPLFKTPDQIAQHALLCEVADLIDAGRLKSTLTEVFGTICAENLKRAHKLIESGRARGKIVLAGF